MKLTVLGCSGSMPGPDSPASGYLLEADGYRLVLDLGHGAFGALQRYVDPADVDAIVISHLHADHCIDLTAYIVALRYGGDGYRCKGPDGRVPLIGPAGTRDRLEAAYDPYARKLGLHELFGFATPADGELGPFAVSFADDEPSGANVGGPGHLRRSVTGVLRRHRGIGRAGSSRPGRGRAAVRGIRRPGRGVRPRTCT